MPFAMKTAPWPRVSGSSGENVVARGADGDAEVVDLQDVRTERRRDVGERTALVLDDRGRAAGEDGGEGERER